MKKIAIDNFRFIIVVCVVAVSVTVIGFLGVTYATDGSSPIYTRDELSGLIDDLKSDNTILNNEIDDLVDENSKLKKIGNFITIQMSQNESNYTPNIETKVTGFSVENSEYDTSLYQFNNDSIIIQKSGYYKVTIRGDVVFNPHPSQLSLYAMYNGSRWFGLGIYSNEDIGYSVAESNTRYRQLLSGGRIEVIAIPFNNSLKNMYCSISVEYLGETNN